MQSFLLQLKVFDQLFTWPTDQPRHAGIRFLTSGRFQVAPLLLHQTFILPEWFAVRRGVCHEFQRELFTKRRDTSTKSTLQRNID
ncbi:hypothetical protein RB4966 [Rhodopirellula baltica SH 1]|uniref:Uncharacterized protein n=1 Tax=Rhodopirellula baltica (strain DSM 10527 / NCIMB 13988 / SH1) TaxID=243090 RepID=Q7UGX5_RHOBA|nr:hypothetical protein RB4966 [Rhodopirellula baltica SH 1]